MLMGDHDFATLIEVADDAPAAPAAPAARILLELGRGGNASTQTTRAFTEGEAKNILKSLT